MHGFAPNIVHALVRSYLRCPSGRKVWKLLQFRFEVVRGRLPDPLTVSDRTTSVVFETAWFMCSSKLEALTLAKGVELFISASAART